MFEFKVTGKELQNYFHVSYTDLRNPIYTLHTTNNKLFNYIKEISIVAVDGTIHNNLEIMIHPMITCDYDRFSNKVDITVTVDDEETAMYLKLKYFSTGDNNE